MHLLTTLVWFKISICLKKEPCAWNNVFHFFSLIFRFMVIACNLLFSDIIIFLLSGKCARELLQKENVKGKRRNKMRKEIEKDLRNHWCSEPRNITNGNVETPCGTGLLQTAKYSCIPGYKLIPEESDKSQCKLNKKWSGKIPVCKSGKTKWYRLFWLL